MNDYCSSGFYKQDIKMLINVNVRINYLLWFMSEIESGAENVLRVVQLNCLNHR